MTYTIQIRRDTAAGWTIASPVLAVGELGLETDTGQTKAGDGATAWPALAYWPSGAATTWAGLLTPTAVKAHSDSPYVAAPGDYVPVDTTSGNVTVTLPAAPPDLTVAGVKHIIQGGTDTVTIACAGTDVFNKAAGSVSMTLTLANQGLLLQYKAAGGIWYVISDDLPLGQLDSRYVKPFNVRGYGATGGGSVDDTAAFAAAIAAASAAGGGTVYLPPGNYLISGSAGVGMTVPAKVRIAGDQDSSHLSTSTPGMTNVIIGSNALTALFNVTGDNVTISGFTVSAANTGCTVPVISAVNRARQLYENIYGNNTGGLYLDGLNRATIRNVNLGSCNSGYGFYLPNQALVYAHDSNVNANSNPPYATLSGVTLTTGFAVNAAVTTLAVSALSAALTAGQMLVLGTLTGNIQTAVVSAAAASGATTVSVVPFTAQNAVASGQPVQQYTAAHVLGGGTWKYFNVNAGAGWAYSKFIWNSGNSYCTDHETNEGAQNGIDGIYLNNASWITFSGFNNNTGLFSGYEINLVNGSSFCSFTGGGTLGGGLSGTVNIDGTVSAVNHIGVSGLYWHTASACAGPDVTITGTVTNVNISGNTVDHHSRPFPFISDQSTTSGRGCVYSGNALTGMPSSQAAVSLSAYSPGSVVVRGNSDVPDNASQRTVTLVAAGSTYTPNADVTDVAIIATPAAGFTVASPTGTPLNGDTLMIRVLGGAAPVPTWGTAYGGSTAIPLPATCTASKTDYLTFQWNAASSKWHLLSYAPGYT